MIYAIAAVLVLIADQWLKYWVTVNIPLDTGSITLIPGVLELTNIHNTGAAFGMLQGGGWRWIFVVLALVFVAVAVIAIRRGYIRGAVGRWAVAGIVAGALGNCIDRVLFGYVVDMFKPTFLEGTVFGAIFNVADMFISCCGILFCIYILFGHEFKKSAAGDLDAEPERPRRSSRASGAHSAGSHAAKGTHSARVPAREAKSRAAARSAAQQPPVEGAQRTRIPVQQPRPRPAQKSAPAPVIDPANPFAEWENKPQTAQKPAEAPAPEPKSAAPETEHEYTLEEILAEFSDK